MKTLHIFLLVFTFSLFTILSLDAQAPKVYLIGDSTCSFYGPTKAPRTGWGMNLQNNFDTANIIVSNKAASGRSSKSFYNELGKWNQVIALLNEGDFLVIQFGHNDQKIADTTRYTEPYTTYQEYLKKYIDEAREKGAYPILATSIHRNKWSGTEVNDSHGDYPPAMRDLASEENVPLVDAHKLTEELMESKGEEYSTWEIFMNLKAGEWENYPDGNQDNTHLQENGAILIARLIAEELSLLAGTFDYMGPFATLVSSQNIKLPEHNVTISQDSDLLIINSEQRIQNLNIYNINGQLVGSETDFTKKEIKVHEWNSGIYSMVFQSNGYFTIKKINVVK